MFVGALSAACWIGSSTPKYHASAIIVPAMASIRANIRRHVNASFISRPLMKNINAYHKKALFKISEIVDIV